MGWKSVKEHYKMNANHIVHVVDENLCIGTALDPVMISVTPRGELMKYLRSVSSFPEIIRYQNEIMDDPELFSRLFDQDDVFSKHMPTFTYKDGAMIEERCEIMGWPHVTHRGTLMNSNEFFDNIEDAVRYARGVIALSKHASLDAIEKYRQHIEELEENVARDDRTLAWILKKYPLIP